MKKEVIMIPNKIINHGDDADDSDFLTMSQQQALLMSSNTMTSSYGDETEEDGSNLALARMPQYHQQQLMSPNAMTSHGEDGTDDFHLPSIDDIPHICLIIDIARYMPEVECDRVFKQIMPELSSVYELVMAERQSKEAREYMKRSVFDKTPWNAGAKVRVSVQKHPCIYVKNAKDVNMLFSGSVSTFLQYSIIPDHRRANVFGIEYLYSYWDEASETIKQKWDGKESLYSLHDNLTALELLDVSNDETELWYMWSHRYFTWDKAEFNRFLDDAGIGPMGELVTIDYDFGHAVEVWLSSDRKLLLMKHKGTAGHHTCVGIRSRSIQFLNWAHNNMHTRESWGGGFSMV